MSVVLDPQQRTTFPSRRHSTPDLTTRPFSALLQKQRLVPCLRSEVKDTGRSFSSSSPISGQGKMSPAPKGTEEVPIVPEGQAQVEQPAKLYFVKMTPNASTPTKGSKLAAGYDLTR